MKTLEIHVPDEIASKIEQAANDLGISIDQLLQASVEEKIQRDAQFERAAGRVLEKNAELYRRLS
jgi:cell division protein FtsI/penicillin-binding protein 2